MPEAGVADGIRVPWHTIYAPKAEVWGAWQTFEVYVSKIVALSSVLLVFWRSEVLWTSRMNFHIQLLRIV